MPRPKKDEKDKRTESFSHRVKQDERKMMRDVADKLNEERGLESETAVLLYLYKKEAKRLKI